MTLDRRLSLVAQLEQLRRHHLVVDGDCWYSCPKSGECCNDTERVDTCTCGADEKNAILDAIIAALSRDD